MDGKKLALYMENIFVSLKSAALKNPEDDVMLVVNAAVPEPYRTVLDAEGIKIKEIPFDRFVMPNHFVWSLAFFKLCALSHVLEEEDYENYLLLDADTITLQSYEEMWEECKTGVILYPLGHTYRHHDRQRIAADYKRLYKTAGNPVHYGGEYIAGGKEALYSFMQECTKVYGRMEKERFLVDDHTGDETILSIAAMQTQNITAALPYIYRYWTNDFYLISTNTVYNPVCIWHLPDEKEHAMRYFYRYYQKKKRFPNPAQCAEIAGIKVAKRPFNRYTLQYKIEGKLKKWSR